MYFIMYLFFGNNKNILCESLADNYLIFKCRSSQLVSAAPRNQKKISAAAISEDLR